MKGLSLLIAAIVDLNTSVILWESGAIVQYLEDVYDKDKKLIYDALPETYLVTNDSTFR